MKIIIKDDYKQVSEAAAEVVAQKIKNNPHAVLGLATGSTPIGAYGELINMCERGEISFKGVSTINLDEYVGIDGEHNQSYRYFMNTNLFDHVDIDKNNTDLPNGVAKDLEEECKRYSAVIESKTRDIQVLGLGRNGHIGFNEPNTPFDSKTHIVNLTEDTIEANSRLFDDIADVPKRAITMGIAEIMQAKSILLIATGKGKAKAVLDTIEGKVTENVPSSVLQNHDDVTIILDREAASELH